ncbi:MAG: sugar transferase [Rhodobacterales bacterium]|nr:sugar transferase [Rhodobacterales bacterium]
MKQKHDTTVFIEATQSPVPSRLLYVPPIHRKPPTSGRAKWIDSDGAKRGFDIIGATLILLFFLPVFMLVAFLILLLHGRPVFFSHTRIGRGDAPFPCLKFRTMHCDAERRLAACLVADPARQLEWAEGQKLRHDPRILGVGRLLRKSSLDELPQLINVLRGDMSLVGPRPIISEEKSKYGDDFTAYAVLRPGITGLWQVSGRNHTTYDERVALDMHYAETRTMAGDLRILLRTVAVVVTGYGAY